MTSIKGTRVLFLLISQTRSISPSKVSVGCVAGQGELKKVAFDPLFIVNHSCASLRANVSRLIRKTWYTTKDPARLKDHLGVFMYFYNEVLLTKTLTPL